MFQNVQYEDIRQENNKIENTVNILKNVFTVKNIVLYIIAFMTAMVGLGGEVSPFSLAITASCLSCGIPAFGIIIVSIIGNIIGFGATGGVNYILSLLVLMSTFLVKKPRYNDEIKNEKIKLGKRLFTSVLVVSIFRYMLGAFTIYNLIVNITNAIIVVIFYKIAVNSLNVLEEINVRKAFSLEEVMGASLVLSIAISALGNTEILGFSIRNILSILLVLILGWKNGVLIGTTSGVTIGATLGIIAEYEPSVVAAFAVSGMIAGLLNRFGKVGVIVGFVIGNGVLAYISNGITIDVQILKEIIIASVALLVVPSSINIPIEELIGKSKFLPSFMGNTLTQGKETVSKLNVVSQTIQSMAETYNVETEEKNKNDENKNIFISELLNNLDNIKENILYDDLIKTEGRIVNSLFVKLSEKQEISRKDLLQIFAENNSYIVGSTDEKVSGFLEDNIRQALNAINSAYRVGKANFVAKEKIKENKKTMQSQLGQISKAISDIATQIEESNVEENKFIEEKKRILYLLAQREIKIEEITINKKKNERFFVNIYMDILNQGIINNDIDKIEKILSEVLKEDIVLNEKASKIDGEKSLVCFMSADKFKLNIGMSNGIKTKSPVSGDSILNIRLKDGKTLIAISDGMGSGAEARKSSQIAIKMLERLLTSGFNKETSIELINNAILNTNEEIYATLDIAIIDLYKGNIEFIKNGACPTYIKNKKRVQILKTISLPAGALGEIKLTTYDKDIEKGDIFLMCSDGVLDSNVEYKNKELWLRYLLEDMEPQNPQKMADIILREAVDNNYGINKDDMSVIVCSIK